MTTKLLCLHGFTQNGSVLREHMAPLVQRFASDLIVEFPDAPHTCAPESVERLYALTKAPRLPPTHLCFFDASDDGREYRGWESSREWLAKCASGADRVGILGFSQGAIVATALCALSVNKQFPAIAFAILVAGRTPRSDQLRPFLESEIAVPSLHVWGERDFAKSECAALVERFEPHEREVAIWPGPHVIPSRGPAADAIVAFAAMHAAG